jgi:AAA domain (Cdc48 subfamily)/C-terminal, D2-small domain, of ClpB protein
MHTGGMFEAFTDEDLEARLRQLTSQLPGGVAVDDLELRHLLDLLLHSSSILRDEYDARTLDRILVRGARPVERALPEWLAVGDDAERRALTVWSVPDALKACGDKCLYDVGLAGRTTYRGRSLQEIGPRSYEMAGQALQLLSSDPSLREFFDRNRMRRLPVEEEVLFLRQCALRFNLYARILQALRSGALQPAIAPAHDKPAAPLPAKSAERGPAPEVEEHEAPDMPEAGTATPALRTAPELDREERLASYERLLMLSSLDLQDLRARLKSEVIDQEEAVDRLCDDLAVFASGTRDRHRPLSYFLVGPTGVGKNHLMESLARHLAALWEIEIPFLTLEGPQYAYPSDVNELKGATRGFIRSDEEGLLAEFHQNSRQAPLSILLVDEVEKAHAQLPRFFLSLMDRGVTMDNRGRQLRFPATLLAFTSNAGYSDIERRAEPIGYASGRTEGSRRREAAAALRRGLPPEFLARLQVLHFRPLGRRSAERILDLEIGRLTARFREACGLALHVTPAARAALIEQGFSEAEGARHLVGRVDRICNVEVHLRLRPAAAPMNDERQKLLRLIREARRGDRAIDAGALDAAVAREMRRGRTARRVVVHWARDRFVYRAENR